MKQRGIRLFDPNLLQSLTANEISKQFRKVINVQSTLNLHSKNVQTWQIQNDIISLFKHLYNKRVFQENLLNQYDLKLLLFIQTYHQLIIPQFLEYFKGRKYNLDLNQKQDHFLFCKLGQLGLSYQFQIDYNTDIDKFQSLLQIIYSLDISYNKETFNNEFYQKAFNRFLSINSFSLSSLNIYAILSINFAQKQRNQFIENKNKFDNLVYLCQSKIQEESTVRIYEVVYKNNQYLIIGFDKTQQKQKFNYKNQFENNVFRQVKHIYPDAVQDYKIQNSFYEIIPDIYIPSSKKIIEILGHNHFIYQYDMFQTKKQLSINYKTKQRIDLLNQLGYDVGIVNYEEWELFDEDEKFKRKYLKLIFN